MDRFEYLKILATNLMVQGNLDLIDSAFAETYCAHAGDKTHKGHLFIKQFIKQMRKAIPDLKMVKIENLSVANDTLTWQRTLTGTHKNSFKGIPASNKKINWYEIVVTRFDQDKIVEEWVASDLAFQLMRKQK